MEGEEVDPRIQGELEKLNQSTNDINKWETELEDGRQKFRAVLMEATLKLDEQLKKIGKAVEDSKPYWEARRSARQAQLEAQKATQDFQRAAEVLRVAKETISLAEERLLEEDSRQFDSAWQEMLNHATQRVMEAEETKVRSELAHKETATKYYAAITYMKQLEKKMKRTISKSRPYFELKAKYYLQLEHLKKNVDERQAQLAHAKDQYKAALRSLEMISDEIHERRRCSSIEIRGLGVGAEGDDIANFKTESDGLSMISVTFEEDGTISTASDEDCENPSSSPASRSHPCASSSSSPSSGPSSLELPATPCTCESGSGSSPLGPRSECSGASSPECDSESGTTAEGSDCESDSGRLKATPVECCMSALSLQHSAGTERRGSPITLPPLSAPVLAKGQ